MTATHVLNSVWTGLGTIYDTTVPFVTPPAISEANKFEPDTVKKATRVYALCLTGFAAALTVLRVSTLGYFVTLLTTGVFAYLESQRANLAADRNAVQEHMRNEPHSHLATVRIRQSVQAAQMLISKNANLNKPDAKGERLLAIADVPVVKKLINGGADVTLPLINENSSESANESQRFKELIGEGKVTYFHDAASAEKVDWLRAIFECKNVGPTDFTPDQQFSLWVHVGTREAASLLKKHGFDPNVRNSRGEVPLDRIRCMIVSMNFPPFEEGSLTFQERAELINKN